MSWVAEAKAIIQKRQSDHLKKPPRVREDAASASPADTRNCIATIQNRLVRVMSTHGLQSGLRTQGRESQLV